MPAYFIQQACFCIPSKLSNVSRFLILQQAHKLRLVYNARCVDLGLEPYISTIQISIERR
jgi:hypothetical protein